MSLTSSSFAILSSPHSELSRDISRIKRRSSAGIGGRPGFDFQCQRSRNPAQCQRINVFGWTTTSASRRNHARNPFRLWPKSWDLIFCGGQHRKRDSVQHCLCNRGEADFPRVGRLRLHQPLARHRRRYRRDASGQRQCTPTNKRATDSLWSAAWISRED